MDSLAQYATYLYQERFQESLIAIVLMGLYLAYYLFFRHPHFLIKGRYEINKKNIGKPLPPYPNGWYNILQSHQLKSGQATNVDVAGQNLVVFRGKDKVVYALAAYCLHMGAHLGVGGEVVNDTCVQCPFHGWLYDGKTGHCVDHDGKALKLKTVEYNDDLCTKKGKLNWKSQDEQEAKLRRYPVSEVNGYIYIWVHAMPEHQNQPIYPMMNVEGFKNSLVYRGKTEHHINCHVQDIPQNGADVLHFKYVHTYILPSIKGLFFTWGAKWKRGDDPSIAEMFDHPKKYIRDFKQRVYKQLIEPFPHKNMLSIGNLQNDLTFPIFGKVFMFSATIIQIGLPIVFVILKSPLYELIFHHYIRPQGKAHQQVFHDCYISQWVPFVISSLASQMEGVQVTNDMYVWQAKRFARKAFLVEGRESDAFIKGWRTWASQHYQGCQEQIKNKDHTW